MTLVVTEVTAGTAVVTLNRPEARNALNPELIAAINEAIVALDGRDDLHAIILTGADPAFCAGVDLKRLAADTADTSGGAGAGAHAAGGGARTLDPAAFAPLPPHAIPVIGAVNGPAVTGGLELALACDFLLASERATFADTHARVGVMPGGGLTVRLPQLIGVNRARQLSFTGDFIDARTAYEWGLVNEIVAHDRLLPRAREVAASIASVPRANLVEIRAMYDAVTGLVGDAAWARQQAWSAEWMSGRFDRTRLAAEREAIVARGRGQHHAP